MQSAALFLLRYLLIAAAIAGAYYSGILARAAELFQQDTATSIPAAVHLVPYNAAYVARLAAWQPDERDLLLHRAVYLNPFDFESWIQLGLLTEMQLADSQTAEREYLQAAKVDKMFLPKWTLTNFYFRQQNASEFFRWAYETLKITPYSSDPVFTQMWLMSQDQIRIAAAVPDRPGILVQYAWFLSNSKQYPAIPQTVQRLIRTVGSGDPRLWGRDDLLGVTLDRMLSNGDLHDALQVWTSLRDGNWIGQNVPDGKHPLTNGDLRLPFYRHGFDWLPVTGNGVRIDQFPEDPAVRLTLYGEQAEHCVLLQQYVPLNANANYALQWKADTKNAENPSGLAWHIRPVQNGETFDLGSVDLLAPAQQWRFQAPPGEQLFLLTLEYTRPVGKARVNETVMLHSVALNRQ